MNLKFLFGTFITICIIVFNIIIINLSIENENRIAEFPIEWREASSSDIDKITLSPFYGRSYRSFTIKNSVILDKDDYKPEISLVWEEMHKKQNVGDFKYFAQFSGLGNMKLIIYFKNGIEIPMYINFSRDERLCTYALLENSNAKLEYEERNGRSVRVVRRRFGASRLIYEKVIKLLETQGKVEYVNEYDDGSQP